MDEVHYNTHVIDLIVVIAGSERISIQGSVVGNDAGWKKEKVTCSLIRGRGWNWHSLTLTAAHYLGRLNLVSQFKSTMERDLLPLCTHTFSSSPKELFGWENERERGPWAYKWICRICTCWTIQWAQVTGSKWLIQKTAWRMMWMWPCHCRFYQTSLQVPETIYKAMMILLHNKNPCLHPSFAHWLTKGKKKEVWCRVCFFLISSVLFLWSPTYITYFLLC